MMAAGAGADAAVADRSPSIRTTGRTSRETLVTKASATRGRSSRRTAVSSTRQQASATSSTSQRVTPSSARPLGAQHAADDREEVAREPLEEAPVVPDEQALVDAGRQPPVGGLAVAMNRVSLDSGSCAARRRSRRRRPRRRGGGGRARRPRRRQRAGEARTSAGATRGRRRVQDEGRGRARRPTRRCRPTGPGARPTLRGAAGAVEAHQAAPAVGPKGGVGTPGEVRRGGARLARRPWARHAVSARRFGRRCRPSRPSSHRRPIPALAGLR